MINKSGKWWLIETGLIELAIIHPDKWVYRRGNLKDVKLQDWLWRIRYVNELKIKTDFIVV